MKKTLKTLAFAMFFASFTTHVNGEEALMGVVYSGSNSQRLTKEPQDDR
jgi:hypothetical protein